MYFKHSICHINLIRICHNDKSPKFEQYKDSLILAISKQRTHITCSVHYYMLECFTFCCCALPSLLWEIDFLSFILKLIFTSMNSCHTILVLVRTAHTRIEYTWTSHVNLSTAIFLPSSNLWILIDFLDICLFSFYTVSR